MTDPRNIEERIKWFLTHSPRGSGMCAQHTWHSLGGDYGNPPRWGADNANEVVKLIIESGRYETPQTWAGPPPRGAVVGWRYGQRGHLALSEGNGKIDTTNPPMRPLGTGIENLDYPKKWGYNTAKGPYTVWTDEYNGVRFPVGDRVLDIVDYDYLDKPGGTFTVTRDYKTLDQSEWTPPRSGWENTFVYLNIKPTFKEGKYIGAIRVRLYREDGDTSGHEDILIAKDALDSDGRTLRHWLYWEKGVEGASTKIQLVCIGGLTSAEISTRYTKKAVVID